MKTILNSGLTIQTVDTFHERIIEGFRKKVVQVTKSENLFYVFVTKTVQFTFTK